MILKIFGAALVAFCGIYASRLMNTSAKAALTEAEGLMEFVRFLRSEIECFALPLPQIIARCPEDILTRCGFRGGEFRTPAELFSLFEIDDGECSRSAERFFSELGRGYRDEQLALCDYYIAILEERRRTLGNALPARRRVNSALCIAGALAVVIIFM